jgi:hypothetical protein
MWDGTYYRQCRADTLSRFSRFSKFSLLSLADRRRPPVRSFSSPAQLDSIDALLREDAASARIERRLAREQRKLRRVSSDAAWAQYLRVEAVHMERSLRWLTLGVAWGSRRRGRQRAR